MSWDDFEDDMKAAPNRRGGGKCSVAIMLETRVPADAVDKVKAALADQRYSTPALREVLAKRLGDDVPTRWSIAYHRRGHCACPKEN